MSTIRRHKFAALSIPILALCLGLLPACGSGGGGSQVIIPEGCVVTEADLQGTWVISHVGETLNCQGGSTLQVTAADNSFTPVNVVRDEDLPGFRITTAGSTLLATVEDVSCHIVWNYLDQDANLLFDCYTTFDPETRTAGGTAEAGHCSQITQVDAEGNHGASCTVDPPFLDTYIVVEGS